MVLVIVPDCVDGYDGKAGGFGCLKGARGCRKHRARQWGQERQVVTEQLV